MANDVVDINDRKPARKAALKLAEPAISTGLSVLLDKFIPASATCYVTRPEDKTEATIVAQGLNPLVEPATLADVREWLLPLRRSVSNPPKEEDFAGRLTAIGFAMSDLPKGVWTAETQARAMRAFKFWPAVAELDELLRPVGDTLRRRHRNAHRIAEGTLVQPARGVSREQEVAYIRSVAASQPGPSVVSEPLPVLEVPTPAQLIAKYERIISLSRDPAAVQLAMDLLARLRAPTTAETASRELADLAERRGVGPRLSAASLARAAEPAPAATQAPKGA